MSLVGAANDGRWRRGGVNQSQSRQQPQSRERSGANTPNRQDESRSSLPSYSENKWSGQDRARVGTATPQSGDKSRSTSTTTSTNVQAAGPVEEQHVPVRDFNASETKEFLKSNYQAAVNATSDPKSVVWKPQNTATPAKPTTPWAPKPSTMVNGKDFWVELTKQVKNLEQGKTNPPL